MASELETPFDNPVIIWLFKLRFPVANVIFCNGVVFAYFSASCAST